MKKVLRLQNMKATLNEPINSSISIKCKGESSISLFWCVDTP